MVGLLVLATLSTSAVVPAESAVAQDQYTVTINASSVYGRGPEWHYSFSPPLPAGYSYIGRAQCRQVIVNGAVLNLAQISPRVPVGNHPLRDCFFAQSLQVLDPGGNVVATAGPVAGTYRVTKAGTELDVDVIREGDRIAVTAVVIDVENEDSTLAGASVGFSYESAGGLTFAGCTMSTVRVDPSRPWLPALGQCEIPAAQLLAGTGRWFASYGGEANYQGSLATGWIEGGLTSVADAARAFAQNTVTIVADYQPPNCYIEPAANASLISISVSVVSQNCTALKVLQITTDVVLSFLPGPGQAVGGIFVKLAGASRHAKAAKMIKASLDASGSFGI